MNLPWRDAKTLYTAVLRRIMPSGGRLVKPTERGEFGSTLSRRDYRAVIDLPARRGAKKATRIEQSWFRNGGNIVVLENALRALSI